MIWSTGDMCWRETLLNRASLTRASTSNGTVAFHDGGTSTPTGVSSQQKMPSNQRYSRSLPRTSAQQSSASAMPWSYRMLGMASSSSASLMAWAWSSLLPTLASLAQLIHGFERLDHRHVRLQRHVHLDRTSRPAQRWSQPRPWEWRWGYLA